MTISEEGLPSRGYWERRNGSYRRSRDGFGVWVPPCRASYEANATGRLTFSLGTDYLSPGRQHSWSDRRGWNVEEKLPELLREIEVRAVKAKERDLEKQRKAEERRRAWERAMEQARERFCEQRRASMLLDEVERWRRASDIRDYCAATEQAYPGSPEVSEWLDWARRHGDRIDPLRRRPRKPVDPDEISPEDLKPFLGRWSPYGPDRW